MAFRRGFGGEPEGSAALALDPSRIVETVSRLRRRIDERFPGSGLGDLAARLEQIARDSVTRLEWVSSPHVLLRVGIVLAVLLLAAVLGAVVVGLAASLEAGAGVEGIPEMIQALEAGTNELLLLGAGLFFLVSLETRIKRRRALGFLRELRAIGHIIDMHQLTKDPDRLLRAGADTPSSPDRDWDRFFVGRYLDYCAEMLSLVGKLSALYAQELDDPVVLSAVDEVEDLTSGLSRKIWQKLMILDRLAPEGISEGSGAPAD